MSTQHCIDTCIAPSSRRSRGQGMTEYLIILVLVAVALIATVNLFGGKLGQLFVGADMRLDDVDQAISSSVK